MILCWLLISAAMGFLAESQVLSSRSISGRLSFNSLDKLLGQLCMTGEPYRAVYNESAHDITSTGKTPSHFLECAPLSDEEMRDYGLEERYIGVWHLRACPPDWPYFHALKQRCVGAEEIVKCAAPTELMEKRRRKRRMTDMTGTNALWDDGKPDCNLPCSKAVDGTTIVGDTCSWLHEPMRPDPTSPHHFLQCQPRGFGGADAHEAACGRWTRDACPLSMEFYPPYQLCVYKQHTYGVNLQSELNSAKEVSLATTLPNSSVAYDAFPTYHIPAPLLQCPPASVAISRCAPPQTSEESRSLVKRQCPGRAFCHHTAATCCTRDFIRLEILIPLIAPAAPAWSTACESPLTQSSLYRHPSTTSTSNYIARAPIMPPYAYTPPRTPTIAVCPSGAVPLANAGCHVQYGGCPLGYACHGGGYCCPAACPPQLVPAGFCYPLAAVLGSANKCPAVAVDIAFYAAVATCGGNLCYGGVCCAPRSPLTVAPSILPPPSPQRYALPTCYNGLAALMACPAVGLCPASYECFSGGCCPLPQCRSGVRAQARCRRSTGSSSRCPGTAICEEGLCCAAPVCPSGVEASVLCSPVEDNCLPGYECHNGGCCPLPRCSTTGGLPYGRCSPTSTDAVNGKRTCPGGSVCVDGLCCALPVCAIHKRPAVSFCGTSPATANGSDVSQRSARQCYAGYECLNGGCCPTLLCSDAVSLPISVCGKDYACPEGYRCEVDVGICCPHRPSSVSSSCRGGYSNNGECRSLPTTPVCPVGSYAISRCSPAAFSCPYASSCHAGTCCTLMRGHAPITTQSYYHPGMPCSHPRDCAQSGGESHALCVRGTCVCVNGAHSNGEECTRHRQVQTTARVASETSPPFAAESGILARDDEGDQTHSTGARRCVRELSQEDMRRVDYLAYEPDSTCLPDEKCIGDRCLRRLRPGEFGCVSDEQCSSRCPNSYCEMKRSIVGGTPTSQCQCKDGLLLYGRCFARCPAGFQESGATCSHENEAAFWMDVEARKELEKVLSQREC